MGRRWTSVAIALAAAVAFTNPAFANDQAGKNSANSYSGFRGMQGIRTDPATVSGVSYVHPAQINMGGGDFIAIGTYKGAGAGACANDYGSVWSLYTDGKLNGAYWCATELTNAYSAGQSPYFRIEKQNCTDGNVGWALLMGGLTYDCVHMNAPQGERATAMLETVGADGVCRNIDVAFRNLDVRYLGNWQDFGVGSNFASSCYRVDFITTRDFDARYGTMD